MAIIFNIDEALSLSAFNVLQEPIKMMLDNQKEAFEKESLISKVFAMHTLDAYQEEYRTRTSMGNYEPGYDMEPAKLSDFKEGYSKIWKSTTWRNSFVISKQAVEDNQMMTISTDAMGFVKSYGRTREIFAFGMLAGALTGSYTQGKFTFDCRGMDTTDGSLEGTKQLFFTKDHLPPVTTGRTEKQSNKFHCHVDLTAPNAHLKILNIVGYVENQMINYTDYDGNPTPMAPTTLLVPNHYAFRNALLAGLKTQYTEVLGNNGLNMEFGKWTVLTTPYLNNLKGFSNADQAFIMIDPAANKENLGAVFIDRVPLEVSSWFDQPNEANVWKGRARYSAGFGDFRSMAYVHCGADQMDALYDTGAKNGGTYNTTDIPEADVAPAGLGVVVQNTSTNPVQTKTVT
jgi:hypothetical protein